MMELTGDLTPVAEAAAAPALRRFDGPAGASQPSPGASPEDFFARTSAGAAAHANEPSTDFAMPAAFAAPGAETASALPQTNAECRLASADLAELSPVELVERFALALKQRRHSGKFPAALLETAAAFELPLRPQASQVPDILAAMAPSAEPVAASAPEVTEAAQVPEAAPEAASAAPPLFAATPASSAADNAPVAATPSPLALPAAMRPIEFSNHDEQDELPDYVPPRSFAIPRMPAAADEASTAAYSTDNAQPETAPEAAPETVSLAENASHSPAELGAEVDVNEEGYSSLLALSKSAPLRQTFVRIDEPADESAPVEPVVIFPGQATLPGTRFSRPSESASPAEQPAAAPQDQADMAQAAAPGMRRFDAPAAGAPGTGAVQDPAEAERALRSALATLQRMSGAA